MLHHLLTARVACFAIATLFCAPLPAVTIYAITDANTLVAFDSATPGTPAFASIPTVGIPVTGLQVGETIVNIDFRPSTGELYGVGSTMRVYKIDVQLNTAAPPATAVAAAVSAIPFTTPAAAKYGMDFNAVPDRIRLVNSDEQNLRLNPINGSLSGTDTNLTPAGSIADVAYDRSFPGSTTTTAYAIDSATDMLERLGGVNGSPSPNGGALTEIGPLGADISSFSAIDFGAGAKLFAVLQVGGVSGLYTISTSTGAATLVGSVDGNPAILGIAVAPQLALVKKKSIKLNFAKADSDSVSFSGTLDVPLSFFDKAPQQPATLVWLGGIQRSFVLDEKGRGVSGGDKLTVAINLNNGAPTGSFKLSLKKGSFAASLVDEGLINADVTAQPVHVPLSIFINSTQFHSSPNLVLSYTAKAGKTGKAK